MLTWQTAIILAFIGGTVWNETEHNLSVWLNLFNLYISRLMNFVSCEHPNTS